MRYLIEAKTKKGEGLIEETLDKEKKSLKLIDKYDPFEKLGSNVEKMGEAMRKFQKSGISWEVFTYYLRGRGISQTEIRGVMGKVKDFFRAVGLLD